MTQLHDIVRKLRYLDEADLSLVETLVSRLWEDYAETHLSDSRTPQPETTSPLSSPSPEISPNAASEDIAHTREVPHLPDAATYYESLSEEEKLELLPWHRRDL
ncbi:hypothetical protein O6R05_07710 [Peptoniphilus equinus]|uniref:Uncharacterized protein n=1 Tax=Peptoniphilus equinus TaxID=3016343 RepID=A0ABY7QSV8_9FIRM|nr:hypothetical protein [Peptoniphilus equinus]WBW49878.1 hypothetical protein O6R05_07710 [Peptoniphilus equinus]